MTTHTLPLGGRYHFFVGSPGTMNIHTQESLFEGDQITVQNKTLRIKSIKSRQSSSYYIGSIFYEIKYEIV